MKLVREHINEKFEEKSDPIHDMGIGIIPIKEVKKLCKQLQNKLNDLFSNENVNVSLQTTSHENTYEIYINLKTTKYKFWIVFLASKDAAHIYYSKHTPVNKIPLKIGWYVENRHTANIHIEYVEVADFDKLIEAIFKADIGKNWNPNNIIQNRNIEIEKLAKKIEMLKTNINTFQTIEKIVRS
jgi:hypothetical protein